VYPVRYVLHESDLLFVLSVGQLARAIDKSIATLQADGFEEDSGQRWTVLAVGPVRHVEGVEGLGPVSESFVTEADSSERGGVFRLLPAILSGRWIDTL